MLSALIICNVFLFAVFLLCYLHQFLYPFLLLSRSKPAFKAKQNHRYAVLICARNEQLVLPKLIDSIRRQRYPTELLDVYVAADNCTDDTADAARKAGAVVYERFNQNQIGKSYALDFLLQQIRRDKGLDFYEAYFIFDADNLLDPCFVAEMNAYYDAGFPAVVGYRNSKNYGDNWISAGTALLFLRDSALVNGPRMRLGIGCSVTGTGYMISSDLLMKDQGWKYHTLTEDVEFSVQCALQGQRIGYCEDAVFYDEQPTRFVDSWRQRIRWVKGAFQVFGRYYGKLLKTAVVEKRFTCYDQLMSVMPAMCSAVAVTAVYLLFILLSWFFSPSELPAVLLCAVVLICAFGLAFAFFGLLTTLSQWDRIHCSTWKKIWHIFTFPVYSMFYLPIVLVSLFQKVEWKPVAHVDASSVEDIQQETAKET